MSCPELIVVEKPPLTPQEKTERLIIVLVVIVGVALLVGVLMRASPQKAVVEAALKAAAASR